jgi:exosortase A-associated hydrolase 2
MARMAAEAFFLPADPGQRFCLYHPPCGAARGAFLYLHPFAEEMNKSRRMAASMARRLAENGYAVLQIDLAGCGDSSGDFGEASWQGWLDDVRRACDWLSARHARVPLWLWGLRCGALLAVAAAQQHRIAANFLFWQPVMAGRQHLQQFLRLKVAGEMIGGAAKGVMEDLKRRLAAGETVEIAGYALNPALAQGLESAALVPPPTPGRLLWYEVSARAEATLSPAAQNCLEQWRAAGFTIHSAVTPAPSFWQTSEIEDAPTLLEATLMALS